MSDLMPCPAGCHTGQLAIVGVRMHSVQCAMCGWAGPFRPTKADAIAAWNTRTVQAQIDAAREAALREVLALPRHDFGQAIWVDHILALIDKPGSVQAQIEAEREAAAMICDAAARSTDSPNARYELFRARDAIRKGEQP